jgi:methylated-DNA-protein-cysteine methyltransferase-like protein
VARSDPDINSTIWHVVAAIPMGKVATYGEIAKKSGIPGAARRVGRALRGLPPDTRIPWHRVLNSQGRISLAPNSESHAAQRERLENEGVSFRMNGSVELKRYGW